MELNVSVPKDDLDGETLGHCVALLADLLERPEDVRLTVTSDFVAAVREKVADAEYAAQYQQDRQFATAMAKTIVQPDGSADLIVDARVLSVSAAPGSAGRTFRHEGLHIAIAERGESLNDIRRRYDVDLRTARGMHLGIAGVAAEEFRVESVLARDAQGALSPEGYTAHFGDLARRFHDHIRGVSIRYQQDLNVDWISRQVADAFHALATSTAYVAAETQQSGFQVPADPVIFGRVLGEPWERVVSTLWTIPPADVPTPRDKLDARVLALVERLKGWIRHLGFYWADEPSGQLRFDVLNPADWILVYGN